MKGFVSVALAAVLGIGTVYADETTYKKEGIGYIKMLGGALKKELKRHLKHDPSGLEALAFCSGSAERITQEVNAKLPKGVRVYRTALKVRNAKANTPDKTDIEVMKSYEKAISEGKAIDKEIRIVDTNDHVRVYKPLVTKPVCLKCHGSALDPKVAEGIKHAYPDDKATGFKVGDLRGVIVAEMPKAQH